MRSPIELLAQPSLSNRSQYRSLYREARRSRSRSCSRVARRPEKPDLLTSLVPSDAETLDKLV